LPPPGGAGSVPRSGARKVRPYSNQLSSRPFSDRLSETLKGIQQPQPRVRQRRSRSPLLLSPSLRDDHAIVGLLAASCRQPGPGGLSLGPGSGSGRQGAGSRDRDVGASPAGMPIPTPPPAACRPIPDSSARCLRLTAGTTGSQTRLWSALGLRTKPALCLCASVVFHSAPTKSSCGTLAISPCSCARRRNVSTARRPRAP